MNEGLTGCRSSRRSFLQVGTGISAALATGVLTESLLAAAAVPKSYPKNAVVIDANENPLGPCMAAREAVAKIAADGGRYATWLTEDLVKLFAAKEGLKPEYVDAYAGSSLPLHVSVLAFCGPGKSFVTADPGYEAGMRAATIAGAKTVKIPLTTTYAHDVKAMTAVQDAGLIYLCTPNNPTGTLTNHADIEFALQNKPKGAILLVDEAYIHFSDATSAIDFVKADRDLIVLRTFSKIYGMAGLRCGLAIGRPDLLEKIGRFAGWNAMPVTAVEAARASLNDTQLVAERKKINASVRGEVFEWLDKNGYRYIPSVSNCFMLETNHPAKEVIEAMRTQNVYIGRVWPSLPTHVRVTVGTLPEMERFQAAFLDVMHGKVQAKAAAMVEPKRSNGLDGLRVRGVFGERG